MWETKSINQEQKKAWWEKSNLGCSIESSPKKSVLTVGCWLNEVASWWSLGLAKTIAGTIPGLSCWVSQKSVPYTIGKSRDGQDHLSPCREGGRPSYRSLLNSWEQIIWLRLGKERPWSTVTERQDAVVWLCPPKGWMLEPQFLNQCSYIGRWDSEGCWVMGQSRHESTDAFLTHLVNSYRTGSSLLQA
jgi:hypothetical protein